MDVKTLAFMLTQVPQDAEVRILVEASYPPSIYIGSYPLELENGFFYDRSDNILYLG